MRNPSTRGRLAIHPALFCAALVVAAAFAGGAGASASGSSIRAVCGQVPLGHARCLSLVSGPAAPLASGPSGYGPADLQSAYNLSSATAGSGQTVAIVDAF